MLYVVDAANFEDTEFSACVWDHNGGHGTIENRPHSHSRHMCKWMFVANVY